ncbi:hypothetical protein Rsub_10893 [Raphidocelis subcapitata]|uniref:Uncharacterized protein n=1 Tax=Raphidocelis subcapitata TaxID=307507 RepID=A0A2V0PDZ1_9CHLO|nr:hypothetical protein Rsub_10893 [Raphidocelis subcapitata]|eukprot:GBF97729.1 hypothetical protein Rsub_10893 [Raphidocelis subcapitata]
MAEAAAEQRRHLDAADAARYREMRQALADFEAARGGAAKPPAPHAPTRQRQGAPAAPSTPPPPPPPRERAFYAALRGVLAACVADEDPASRAARLAAAHAWFTLRCGRDA